MPSNHFGRNAKRSAVDRILAYQTARDEGDRRSINLAATSLIEQFGPLLASVVRKYGRLLDTDEVEQIAQIALLEAAQRFDPEIGCGGEVSSFMAQSVKYGVSMQVTEACGGIVAVPGDIRRRMPTMRREIENGAAPHDVFSKMAKRMQRPASFADYIADAYAVHYAETGSVDDPDRAADLISGAPSAAEIHEKSEQEQMVNNAIDQLTYPERVILRSRTGIGLEMSAADIASTLSSLGYVNANGTRLSYQTIHQLEASARRNLKRKLRKSALADAA